ncbi:MAG: hypothetical protein PHT54_03060 [Candidatus Nanoarchaeia archaeon]|nr:hypothetical protein [Candidatus Nanoarchaeia archaeon]
MMKRLNIMLLTLVFTVLVAASVSAVGYEISEVEIDGIEAASGTVVYAEADKELGVDVFINYDSGNTTYDNVKVKAWIGGYEYGDVEETTDPFVVEPGVSYKKTVSLYLPDDMEGNEDYTLHVKVYDEVNSKEYMYTLSLRVQSRRHSLKIQDVIVRPSTSFEAGMPLFVTVRVENLGQKKEEDIKVTATIPELGVSARDYIDELTANEDADISEDNEDEEDSASSDELYLKLPDNAAAGVYTLNVDVDYNRGNDRITTTKTITVVKPEEAVVEEKPLVNFDSTSKSAAKGEEVTYKVTIANMDKESGVYSVEVEGTDLFANSRVDPAFVLVPGEGTASANLFLMAKDSATSGMHSFTVKVLKAGELIKEETLTLEVSGETSEPTSTQTYLVIGFIILVVILIILGVAVLVGRNKPEEPRQYY